MHKLSFFIHNFMDARGLEKERIDACVFTAATGEGPVSMCLHNAKRDFFILHPVRIGEGEGGSFWDPFSGATSAQPIYVHRAPDPARKRAKGRAKREPARAAAMGAGEQAD